MIVIGENINASIKEVEAAILRRDESFVRELAKRQKSGGADYLEVNSGLRVYPEEEAEDIEWLVPLVQTETGLPLCIDSAYALVHKAALKHHQGRAILNSVNGDPRSWEEILPLVKEYGCGVVALLSDRQGIPSEASGRLKIAENILEALSRYGVSPESLYFDPVVMPISVDTKNAVVFLETLGELKRAFPEVNTVSALSNVSFGLPRRGVINRAFFVLSMEAGLDAAIVNPLDQKLMALKMAGSALLNRDSYCFHYLAAYREGKLE